MKILHGTWIPQANADFLQTGAFFLWVETEATPKTRKKQSPNRHPKQLNQEQLLSFLRDELKLPAPKYGTLSQNLATKYFFLPSSENEPVPSPELSRYLETEPPEATQWKVWEIDCYHLTPVIKLLNEIHFLGLYNVTQMQLGADLLFWYHYTQSFKSIIFKDQYIPALKYRELAQKKGKRQKRQPSFEIYPSWEILSPFYEENLRQFIEAMPVACTAGFSQVDAPLELYDKETLLRHFSE